MNPLPLHNDLYNEMYTELQQLEQEPDPVKQAVAGVSICFRYLNKLKARLDNQPPTGKAAEIQFFKEVKPFFLCWLIYYCELFQLFAWRKPVDGQPHRKGIKRLRRRMKKFHKRNYEFYAYCRVENTDLDEHYFLRCHYDLKLNYKSQGAFNDPTFCTNNDYKLARMLAYDELEKFLLKVKQKQSTNLQARGKSKFTWTAAKTYVKEVALGFHLAGFLNHGKTNIIELAMDLAEHYNISIDDMNQVIQQLKRLTKTNTPCLDQMRTCIAARLDQSEDLHYNHH
jgi:hypothetical protein